jgi:type IV pilus assembly protein PilV
MLKKSRRLQKIKNLKKHIGAGLIEVMVSLLILGVGLLGVLSLQANGLNSNQRAIFVTEAQMLAQDMAERILSYGSGDSGADGTDGVSYAGISKAKIATAVTFTRNCDADDTCDGAQTKIFDEEEWQVLLSDSSLPSALGEVTWSVANSAYTVAVMWDQNRTGTAPTACNSDNCFSMEVQL